MNWALFGLCVVTLAITLFWVFRLTVTVSRTASNALATLISFDQRASSERMALVAAHREDTKGLIDRIMSGDWESVRLHEGADDTPSGGFFTPEEQRGEDEEEEEPIVEMVGASSWRMSNAKERADALDEVAALAAEDDLDSYEAERSAAR